MRGSCGMGETWRPGRLTKDLLFDRLCPSQRLCLGGRSGAVNGLFPSFAVSLRGVAFGPRAAWVTHRAQGSRRDGTRA